MKNGKADNGAFDALEKIKAAEEKARKTISEASEEKSLKIIQQAQIKARSIKEKSLNEAREKAQKMRAKLIKEAEEEAEQIHAETRREIEALRRKGESARAEAIKKVSAALKEQLKSGAL